MNKIVLPTKRPWSWKVYLVLIGLIVPATFAILPYAIHLKTAYSEPGTNTGIGWEIMLLNTVLNSLLIVGLGGIGLLLTNRIGLGLPFVEGWVRSKPVSYTLDLTNRQELLSLVNHEKGTVDRSIFTDEAIYQLEMERIFARAWNFMCHDSQIPNPGDFFMTFIGEDRVICVRDNDGNPQVLINSCRHRGAVVAVEPRGNARRFSCPYHAWTYDQEGALVAVFRNDEFGEVDKSCNGLTALKCAERAGLVGVVLDPKSPLDIDTMWDGHRRRPDSPDRGRRQDMEGRDARRDRVARNPSMGRVSRPGSTAASSRRASSPTS